MYRNEKQKSIGKCIGYLFAGILGSVILGTVLMVLVYCLPTDRMKENVKVNLEIYKEENYTFFWAPRYSGSYLDLCTDSLMQNIAVYTSEESVLQKAMKNWRVVHFDGIHESLAAVVAYEGGDRKDGFFVEYPRYWHGYLIFLKPALLFTSMSGILMLNMTLQFILAGMTLIAVYRVAGFKAAIPFGLAVLALNPVSTGLCLQYSAMYYITLISVFLMFSGKIYRKPSFWKLFFWVGVSTAFFDLLTFPLVGLGVNLIFLILMQRENLKSVIEKAIASCFAWLIGYGGMWFGKWAVSSVITGENVFRDAFGAAAVRISGEADSNLEGIDTASAYATLRANVNAYWNLPARVVFLLFVMGIVFLIFKKKYRISPDKIRTIALFLVSCLPVIWFLVLRNHSAIHYLFTHRNFSVTIMGISAAVLYSLKEKKEKIETGENIFKES